MNTNQGNWEIIFNKAKTKSIKVFTDFNSVQRGLFHYRQTMLFSPKNKPCKYKITDYKTHCTIEPYPEKIKPLNVHIL